MDLSPMPSEIGVAATDQYRREPPQSMKYQPWKELVSLQVATGHAQQAPKVVSNNIRVLNEFDTKSVSFQRSLKILCSANDCTSKSCFARFFPAAGSDR
jgi:hypothetical protein